ncbi:uncharacterized protein B0T15DRAFT_133478 [Chaetomium strumarium]|uniref:Uncharacterized protein n=1 Tax=Chaetomium strumarium TaxID=1170767 RepID=A0AAJ0M4Y3_9PEZI|nr:hypothetical protein B0T15DRAFT_133478 [Chaetomium strumarium]
MEHGQRSQHRSGEQCVLHMRNRNSCPRIAGIKTQRASQNQPPIHLPGSRLAPGLVSQISCTVSNMSSAQVSASVRNVSAARFTTPMTPNSHYHLPDLGLVSSHGTRRPSVAMSDLVSQDSVIGEAEDESVVIANGLTYRQIRDLWDRVRPSLRGPFRGRFDSPAFDVSLARIRRDRTGIIGEYPRPDIWSETAALWERHEKQFVCDFEELLLKRDDQRANPRKVGQTEAACTAGGDGTAFEAQFRLIEQAKKNFGCEDGEACHLKG